MAKSFMVDWSKEKIFELKKSGDGEEINFRPVFKSEHKGPILACKNCGDELGNCSDRNIAHQCEYHSCSI